MAFRLVGSELTSSPPFVYSPYRVGMCTLLMAPLRIQRRGGLLEVSPTSKESANYLERILSAGSPPLLKIKGGWEVGGSSPPSNHCSPSLLSPPSDQSGRMVVGGGGPPPSPSCLGVPRYVRTRGGRGAPPPEWRRFDHLPCACSAFVRACPLSVRVRVLLCACRCAVCACVVRVGAGSEWSWR